MQSEISQTLGSGDASIVEAIVTPGSLAQDRSARDLRLHLEFGLNLLGVSRRGQRFIRRLSHINFRLGDVLLLQGPEEVVQTALPRLGLLPLAEREIRLGQRRRLLFPLAVFATALLLTSFDILSVQVSFVAAVLVLLVTRIVTLQEAYEAIDWPVIVLLGAMIPVGEALEMTGGAARIAATFADLGGSLPPWAMLGIVLVTTMLLSAVINNAAAVILMAPIGINVAENIGASIDPFLMRWPSRVLRVSVAHRSPVEYHRYGAWRIPVRGLFENGPSAGGGDSRGLHSRYHVGLAHEGLASKLKGDYLLQVLLVDYAIARERQIGGF